MEDSSLIVSANLSTKFTWQISREFYSEALFARDVTWAPCLGALFLTSVLKFFVYVLHTTDLTPSVARMSRTANGLLARNIINCSIPLIMHDKNVLSSL